MKTSTFIFGILCTIVIIIADGYFRNRESESVDGSKIDTFGIIMNYKMRLSDSADKYRLRGDSLHRLGNIEAAWWFYGTAFGYAKILNEETPFIIVKQPE